jgi:hypothetical protein
MVDALQRARRMVRSRGIIIDVHPTATPAVVEVGPDIVGTVTAGDAPQRHRAATDAITSALESGALTAGHGLEFTFSTYADSIDELRDYIVEHWRNATIDPLTVSRARVALDRHPRARPRARETVQIVALRLR